MKSAEDSEDDSHALQSVGRTRALTDQIEQTVLEFRAHLREAVTGNPQPVLELSREARLYKDPDEPIWTCAACRTEFSDIQIFNLGRLIKIKDELIFPIWQHLWTEKDEFRKKEVFETNRELQELATREAEALRGIADQYLADLRDVRRALLDASLEGDTKRQQLAATLDGLLSVKVLTQEEFEKRIAAMGSEGNEIDGHKRHAEGKEDLMNAEPEAQVLRRPTAVDPMNVVSSPSVLFKEISRNASRNLLLAPPNKVANA